MSTMWRHETASEPDEERVFKYTYLLLMILLLVLQIVHLIMGFVGIHYDKDNRSDSSIELNKFFVSAHVISFVYNVWMTTGHFNWTFGTWHENILNKILVFFWVIFPVNSVIGIFLSLFLDPSLEFGVYFAIIQLIDILYSMACLGFFG
jgi:hypothetical protein